MSYSYQPWREGARSAESFGPRVASGPLKMCPSVKPNSSLAADQSARTAPLPLVELSQAGTQALLLGPHGAGGSEVL